MMKRVRGFMSFLLVVALVMSTAFNGSLVFANNGISVEIDGMRVNFPDQQPVIVDGRTLVPVRGVFETLGYSVSWEQSTNTATLSNGVNTILVTVGSPVFINNGNVYNLDVPAQIINGRTMLPFRAVLESVGCGVDWDGANNNVIVSSVNSNNPITVTTPTVENNTSFEGIWLQQEEEIYTYFDIKTNGTFIYDTFNFFNGAWYRGNYGNGHGTYTVNSQNNIVFKMIKGATIYNGEYKLTNNGMTFQSIYASVTGCFNKVDSMSHHLDSGNSSSIGNNNDNEQKPTPTPTPIPQSDRQFFDFSSFNFIKDFPEIVPYVGNWINSPTSKEVTFRKVYEVEYRYNMEEGVIYLETNYGGLIGYCKALENQGFSLSAGYPVQNGSMTIIKYYKRVNEGDTHRQMDVTISFDPSFTTFSIKVTATKFN